MISLSICIPNRNNDATELVASLRKQCLETEIDFEIILLDDASDNMEAIRNNARLSQYPEVRLLQNEKNMGLARTRNKLGQLAKYNYLLFIDSDAAVAKDNYIQRYTHMCIRGIVTFGGCVYPEEIPESLYILRWKYGKNREEGVGKYPSCFNFLIDKEVFLQYLFNESLSSRYGYEDTLFGQVLASSNIDVCFVDNPMVHLGLDPADVYLRKIRESLHNLLLVESYLSEQDISPSIKILKVARQLQKMRLDKILRTLFKYNEQNLIKNLKGKKPILFLLDLYKLGYLCKIQNQ